MIESENYTITYSISYDCVDVFSVFFPFGLFLIKFDCIVNLLQEFVYNNTAILDADQFVSYNSFKNVVILLRGNWFVLSFNHRFPEFCQFSVHKLKRLFHFIDDLEEAVHYIFCFVDKNVDLWRLPFVFCDSWLDLLVHSDDSLLDQWFLYIVQTRDDFVVVLDNKL